MRRKVSSSPALIEAPASLQVPSAAVPTRRLASTLATAAMSRVKAALPWVAGAALVGWMIALSSTVLDFLIRFPG